MMEANKEEMVSLVWLDVKQDIEIKIITGEYPEGERIPPVRKIAESYSIGINTAQKVVEILCKEDVIYKKRGIGYFVQPMARDVLFNKHQQKLEKMIQETMDYAGMLQIDPSDIAARYAEKMKGTNIN